MSEEMNFNEEMELEELETVSGGGTYGPGATHDALHNLDNFTYYKVCNVVHYDSTACLTMRMEPNGAIIRGVGWQNGQKIRVNKSTRKKAWVFAYKNGRYGYVNRNYIDFT